MIHKAKKSLGQNFLKDKRAIRTMCDVGAVSKQDTIIEIGPGKGVLTAELLSRGANVIAIEKDKDLIEILKERFNQEIANEQLIIIEGDCLEYTPLKEYKLIANIPYNITGAIFKRFLSEVKKPKVMILLVQKEVAERVVAKDGKESILSLSVKLYGEPKYVMKVSKKMFSPAPKVDSAVVSVSNIRNTESKDTSEKIMKIIKAGFAHKRKVVIKNLENIANKNEIEEAFEKLHIDKKARAEDLPLLVWQKLVEYI